MKKIINSIILIACVALCAAVWPRSTELGDLPTKPVNTAVTAEIETQSEEIPQSLLSAEIPVAEADSVKENEQPAAVITAEEKAEKVPPADPAPRTISKSAPVSTESKSCDRTVIDGKPHLWNPGFGWIVDEGGDSVGTTVGNPGDELTGTRPVR